jgi:hypothetical protein
MRPTRQRPLVGALLLLALPAATLGAPAVQPVFVRVPGVAEGAAAQTAFAAHSQRLIGGRPPIAVDLAAPPPPRASAALATAAAFMGELRWPDALRELETAAHDAVVTGAAGLSPAELSDIYLFRAIVRQKLQPAETARIWEDYVRAATYTPERVLDPGRVSPTAVETWSRAVAAVQARASATLIVRAPADATIAIDGRTPVRSPALVPGLRPGEHLVRVEEPGRWPWAVQVPISSASVEMDVPVRPELSLDDGSAADLAAKHQARFALVAEPRPGRGQPLLVLRLVDTATRLRRAAAVVLLPADRELGAAIERLLAESSGAALPPARPTAAPSGHRLTLLLSVAGALAAGVTAGLLIDRARSDGAARTGFSATVDLPDR